MSLIARVPSNSSFSASESPVKRSYGNQNPWSAKAEKEDRTGQPVVGSYPRTAPGYYHEQFTGSSFSARYSKCDDNKGRSSQEWKADKPMDDGTGQPVVIPQRNEAICHRKRRKTFYDMGIVHVCTVGILSIHGKELLRQLAFRQEYKRLHIETNVRQICKISV